MVVTTIGAVATVMLTFPLAANAASPVFVKVLVARFRTSVVCGVTELKRAPPRVRWIFISSWARIGYNELLNLSSKRVKRV
jgi:hypothetical protein